MSLELIKKQYAPWVHGTGGSLAKIQKASSISQVLKGLKGEEMYQEYLAKHPEQVYAGGMPIAKSQPTPGDVHINQPLTMISVAFLQDMDEFISDKVFPNIPVPKNADRFFSYPKGQWFRSDAQERAPGTESAGSGYDIDSTPTYVTKQFALHRNVPDQLRANADSMIDLDREATEFVTRQMAIKREREWAASFFTTTVWTGSTTGGDITPGTLWSAPGSTPIEDIRAQRTSIKTKTGYKPNTLVLGQKVWDTLQDHPEFTDRIKFTERGIIGLDLIAAVLEIDQVLVAGAVHNTAAEGAATVMTQVLDSKDALLCYSNPRPSLMTPSAGYIFSWTGYLGAGPAGQRMSRFRMQELRSDRVEIEASWDMKVVSAELGAFFNNAVS